MITLLVGHRGCGKSSLLRRIATYLPEVETVDLDGWIAREQGRSVGDIFRDQGEEHFRRLERRALDRVAAAARGPLFVALGAGFPGPLPAGTHCLWVRRDGDGEGRLFLDRPRLDPGRDPLEEYRARFPGREERYRGWCDEVLTLREGFTGPEEAERLYFTGGLGGLGGALTVLPGDFREWEGWVRRRLAWGVGAFEVRDDLLDGEQRERALARLPAERVIYSLRKPGAEAPPPGVRVDRPLEWGPPGDVPPGSILSLHRREPGESVAAAGARLAAAGGGAGLLKLAPATDSFADLGEGHRWAAAEPGRRAFLPLSPDGRWAWYRLLHRDALPLNFFREGGGSAPDQPLLLDWADPVPRGGCFAAILGDPVGHSLTPAEHREWFRLRGMAVYRIRVTRAEWEAGALEALRELGLRAAAVTAPLKDLAAAAADRLDAEARDLGVANTLAWDGAGGGWRGANTDRLGLARVLADLDTTGETAVWGGGGTLPVLRSLLPAARFHAARTGRPRTGPPAADPVLLVWASGLPGAEPPPSWRPATILDLGYREDSPGRRYAIQAGAHYISGEAMFREQARLQREFWGSLEG